MPESIFQKLHNDKFIVKLLVLIILTLSLSFTCYKKNQLEKEYIGSWSNETTKINVRTKTGFMKYKFTPITVPVSLAILPQGIANCKIGEIEKNNLTIIKNIENAEKTGVVYVIKLGEIGQINNTDPLSKKELELWIKPIKNEKVLQVEIRQMHLLDAFPMGEAKLIKTS